MLTAADSKTLLVSFNIFLENKNKQKTPNKKKPPLPIFHLLHCNCQFEVFCPKAERFFELTL